VEAEEVEGDGHEGVVEAGFRQAAVAGAAGAWLAAWRMVPSTPARRA
jgi:hypothetical protein